jgi:hypothetical protein
MQTDQPLVRQNYLAILVAAIACFLFEAGWYSYFLNAWIEGIGRSREWLMSQGVNPALQYATALLWLGFVVTTWATEYVFELRSWALFGVNTGFWLIGMVVMGAIIGAWKKK